jgi:hypothetical protein
MSATTESWQGGAQKRTEPMARRPSVALVVVVALLAACQSASPTPSVDDDAPTLFSRTVHFATLDEARALLGAEDDFTRALGPFDRGFRLRTTEPVDDATYRRHAAQAALAWRDDEKAALTASVRALDLAMRGLALALPEPVILIVTDGSEEFGAAYTRQHAIVLPRNDRQRTDENRLALLAHELFHVASRHGAGAFRDEVYALLGFTPITARPLPRELVERRLTNPDAHTVSHAITLETPLGPRAVVPVLTSRLALHEAFEAPHFMDILDLRLVVPDGESGWLTDDAGHVLSFSVDDTDFTARLRHNTDYVIHPEEVLADNFAMLALGRAASPARDALPGLMKELERVLSSTQQP